MTNCYHKRFLLTCPLPLNFLGQTLSARTSYCRKQGCNAVYLLGCSIDYQPVLILQIRRLKLPQENSSLSMRNDHQWPLHHVSSAREIIWFFGGNNASLWTYGRRHVRAIDFARFGMRWKTQDQSGLGRDAVFYWHVCFYRTTPCW